eukprot:TRINITY_DN7250_c0_g4_i2.p1 TRINITY_DN7250_c0_g4~~TRINITY_DN7250_c0_g4_i2.p1  ORF type:complete len:275 (+),score=47.59 TRINITY_DN7250_c0_g4_i2:112-936(+)
MCIRDRYNTVLGADRLGEDADVCVVFDNDSIEATLTWRQQHIGNSTMNRLCTLAMSGATSTMRFAADEHTSREMNADLRRLGENLVPFPRLRFLTATMSHALIMGQFPNRCPTVPEVIHEMFDSAPGSCRFPYNRILAMTVVVRGRVSPKELRDQAMNMPHKYPERFLDWAPDMIQTSACSFPRAHENIRLSATGLVNSTVIQDTWRPAREHLAQMHKSKMHHHWFEAEGVEATELFSAKTSLDEVLHEYQLHNYQGPIDSDDDDDYDEDEFEM